MEFTIQLLTAVIFWTSLAAVGCSNPASDICPKREGDTWRVDQKDGKDRCILKCSDGYVPSGCHVISPRRGGGYNIAIPICEKAPYVSSETLVAVGGCTGVVLGIPYALYLAGFTAVGIAASSIASWLQGTASTSLVATLQSTGAAGTSVWAKATIGGVCFTAADYVMLKFTGCEAE